MNDNVKFEWKKLLRHEAAQAGSLTGDGGSVILTASYHPERPVEQLPWRFLVSVWVAQADPTSFDVSPPSVTGWCASAQEARAKAETFGRRMLEVTRILTQPLVSPAVPKAGDEIYIPSSDDHFGGKAWIKEVVLGRSAGEPCWFVTTAEAPGSSYNYSILLEDQKELSERFGDRRACLDSDYNLHGGWRR
jgi:hypothetical protein